jgi:peptidyl-prolyl cis-trans isomerase C
MRTSRLPYVLLAAALALASAGCNRAKTSPEAQVDLSNGTDFFRQPVPPSRALPGPGPIATVNGVDITAEAFIRELNARMSLLQQRYPPEQLEQMQSRIREQILDQMIARQLILQEANRVGMTVSDDEMASYRAELEAALPPGVNLASVLAQRGISEEQFKREFSDDIRVRKLVEQATQSATEVADAEVQLFYEENQEQFKQPELATARHLLVAVNNERDKEAAREKAARLRERLLAGEDFAELVRAETDDPGSRETGGLYTFPRGQMVPEFENASFTQEIGAIGDLVETRFGFHIIKVEKREAARDIPLEEVRSNVVSYLRNRKAPEAVQEYLNGLRQKAQIVVHQTL